VASFQGLGIAYMEIRFGGKGCPRRDCTNYKPPITPSLDALESKSDSITPKT
jgi:hypothetical protein